jgi:hypothetical protein
MMSSTDRRRILALSWIGTPATPDSPCPHIHGKRGATDPPGLAGGLGSVALHRRRTFAFFG